MKKHSSKFLLTGFALTLAACSSGGGGGNNASSARQITLLQQHRICKYAANR